MTTPSQPVNYLRLNLIFRIGCLCCVSIAWIGMLLYAILEMTPPFSIDWLLFAVSAWAQGLSLFFCCVFAFAAIASNSISGQSQLSKNAGPLLCIGLILVAVFGTRLL
ncbi:hypothetical protein [Thalassoglobus polymorphus]|nr:hypothetical protein [Thalassoglobus polymorphus]